MPRGDRLGLAVAHVHRAALEARVDSEMAIIGRTNAGVIGFEEVIARAQAYEKAGADAICLVGIEDFDHLESIASQLSKPLMLVTYGNPNLRDNARLAAPQSVPCRF